MAIKAIIFDLDDTLIEQRPANEAIFRAVCEIVRKRCGTAVDELYESINRHGENSYRAGPYYEYCFTVGIGRNECLWGEFPDPQPEIKKLADWLPQFRREVWTNFLAEHGLNDAAYADQIQNEFITRRKNHQVIFPDVQPVLEKLRQRYTLALLTNGGPTLQRFKIEASGLTDYFAHATISGELGFGKPDPRIFEHALDQLKISADEAVMIGDNLLRDVLGARNAGICGIWVNRFNDPSAENVTPDTTVTNLTLLPEIF